MDINSFVNTYNGIFTLANLLVTIASGFVSVIVLVITYRTWKLKCGNKVIGYYHVERSIDSSSAYINEIVLQNMKDKDVTIHDIYIRFGRNIYLDMLDKDHENYYVQVLPPLGTLFLKFGPAIKYLSHCEAVDMDDLIFNQQNSKIVLVTNVGKIVVDNIKTGWNPHAEFFKNYGTVNVQQFKYYTAHSVYRNGKLEHEAIDFSSYGDKVKYLVKMAIHGKEIEYRVFDANSKQVQKFSKIKFSKDSLASTKSLRLFLTNEKDKGNIDFDEIIDIIDLNAYVQYFLETYNINDTKPPISKGWLEYEICDRVQSWWWNIKEDFQNVKDGKTKWNFRFRIFQLFAKMKDKK